MYTMLRYTLCIVVAVLLFVLAFSSRAHATAPTGYDVLRVELPQLGYAQLFAGCTLYPEPMGELVIWCEGDVGSDALTPHTLPGATTVWGVVSPAFTWWPSEGACRTIDVADEGTYTAYTITCSDDDIFAGNFGD